MHNKKKTQLLLANFSVFIMMFSIFSFILYSTIKSTQYVRVDNELNSAKNIIMRGASYNFSPMIPPMNPRITTIIYGENGEIIQPSKNYSFFEQNSKQLKPKELDRLYDFTIGEYSFRTISFSATLQGKFVIVQLITNTNPERDILTNLLRILIIGGIVISIVSVAAALYLADKSMKPIIDSWNKQKEFVENASHELRTPLTIIQSKLELMLLEPKASIMDKYELLAPALSETRRISKMVSDLLTLARSDSNTTELEKSHIDITKLIKNVSEPYKEIAEAEGKSLNLKLQQDISIFADEKRLNQLIIILLDNSLKYTEEGCFINIKACIQNNDFLLEVSDNGIGIKEENRKRIFERFFREDKARSRKTGGSGLGLSIAKWIVEKHEGVIEASPVTPKGTLIKVIIPLKL